MKKFISLVLIILVAISFVSCSSSEVNDTSEELQTEAIEDFKQPELLDSGYYIIQDDDMCDIYYSVEIKNPNEKYAMIFPTITITSKDNEGNIIDTQEQVIQVLAANDTVKYANWNVYEGEKASTVEISVYSGTDSFNFATQDDSKYPYIKDFTVSNINVATTKDDTNFTGEVKNEANTDMSEMCIAVTLYKDDKIVGGYNEFVDDVFANQSKAFKISLPNEIKYDRYEINAFPWDNN